jgi:hypothetical protein
MGRIAVWMQAAGFSTIVIFPLMIGALLGAAIVLVASQFGETNRMLVLLASLLGAIICVTAEHGFFYLDYCSNFAAKLDSDPKTQLAASINPQEFRPASFPKFMAAAIRENWPLWTIDALAMIAAAGTAGWLLFASSRPATKPQAAHPNPDL